MSTRSIQSNTKTILIPDLEQAMEDYNPRYKGWSQKEEAIMLKYYNKVSIDALIKTLGRSKSSIQDKASRMGITGGKT